MSPTPGSPIITTPNGQHPKIEPTVHYPLPKARRTFPSILTALSTVLDDNSNDDFVITHDLTS